MSSRIKSALWMLFASLNFALLNTLVKFLSANYSLSQILNEATKLKAYVVVKPTGRYYYIKGFNKKKFDENYDRIFNSKTKKGKD